MSSSKKNQKNILQKLGIERLNAMQEEAMHAIHSNSEVVLISPTGTGKTLAFLLPIIQNLDADCTEVQALILVPSRELAIQIEQVAREMGSGYKANAVFGGQPMTKDKSNLKHRPAILIGTPGRVADHLRKESFTTEFIQTLVLDEFDKSLEVGFEEEMSEILSELPALTKKVLTSATHEVEIPEFVGLEAPKTLIYKDSGESELNVKRVLSPSKDKLDILVSLLRHIGDNQGVIFCNFKESIQRVSDFLNHHGIGHGCFYGGLEQYDREMALIKFRNGTHRLLLATDLATRGIDVPEMDFIIHYHLPLKEAEFTHRNGRTARMNSGGVAYVLQWEQEELPDFINQTGVEEVMDAPVPSSTTWKTVSISGGRKDKISKGDIAGLFFKQGKLNKHELGRIELKQDSAFVAVEASKADQLIKYVDNSRLKKKKVRVKIV